MRELVVLGYQKPVLIEAGALYMYLFFALREVYSDETSLQDGYGDLIMDYARNYGKLIELKDSICFCYK